ncbi:NUDIX domain-containing protein [Pelagicoccus sp. SDUM812003]|uniref:NUDIX domain-containing protein n=1 Tax=Pelagicoccus sp. SDUM812003 TaxID=3041267 RepID=UPI00280C9C3A|nr:NUDIX domain-containing protein [Pelagicoccus sp. SDUM812003]MDQ8203815.1 NUDIX domain-containing protein [Pelagicoccus sp. SDUM812003]
MPNYQVGVFATTGKNSDKVILVTSRTGERWIFPKGNTEKGRSDRKVAEEEALEEAGIIGTLKSGYTEFEVSYGETKYLRLYQMKVKKLLDKYPESKERKRAVLTMEEAYKRLGPDLQKCLKKLAQKHL